MSTLSKALIEEYLTRDLKDRLVITPMLDYKKQVKDTSIDLRLGTEFIITKKTNFPLLDPTKRNEIEKDIEAYQNKITIGINQSIILHPGQFLLGSTLEYLSIPNDLCGYCIGRSSWGRLGLIIATATFVNQGFKGCLTLELANIGEVPLTLYPGLRICQLILHKVDGKGEYESRYRYPVGPEFSRVYDDEEIEFWGKN
jgi:dCTP deaminase